MRSLKPINEQGALLQSTSERPITNAQYEELVEKTQEAVDCANAASQATSDLATSLQSNVNTSNITADNIQAGIVQVDALDADAARTITMDGPYVQWDNNGLSSNVDIDAPKVTTDCAVATALEADTATIGEITAESLNVDNFNPTNLNVSCANATHLDATYAEVTNATVTNETVSNADITTANIGTANITEANADEANLTCANITDGKATKIDIAYITHTQTPQVIDSPIDQNGYYIVTPAGFKNGHLDIIGMIDDTTVAYVIRVQATEGNFVVQWTKNNAAYLDTFYFDNTGNQLAIKAAGANRIYKQMSSFDCTSPLQIYSLNEYNPAYSETMDVSDEFRGTYIPWVLTTNRFKAEDIEIESVDFENINVSDSISLPASKDQYGQVETYTEGMPGQYVTNVVDEHGSKYPKWVNPASSVTECDTSLMSSDAVFNYDGTATDCDGCTAYPIKNLGNESTVHGDFAAPNFAAIDADNTTQSIDDVPDGTLVTIKDTVDGNDVVRKGTRDATTVADPVMFAKSGAFTTCDKLVRYDHETNTFVEATEAVLDNIDADSITVGTLSADKAFIKELDTVKEETISSTGNYVALRANNESAMTSSETAGILVSNVDGNGKASAMVADNNGIVKVGTGTPTNTTYPILYFNKADSEYYTDIEDPSTLVTPSGAMTRWDSVEDTDEYTKWTNAVFSVIDFVNTEHYIPLTDGNYVNAAGEYIETVPSGGSIGAAYTIMNGHDNIVIVDSSDDVWFGAEQGGWYGYAKIIDIRLVGSSWYAWLNMSTFTTTKPDGYETTRTGLRLWDVEVDSLEPLTTREDSANMADQGLTKWNSTGNKIDTVAPPVSEAYLKFTPGTGYQWETPQAGVFHYATEAAYLADAANVPVGSAVVIDEYDNYVYGDNQ